MEARRPARGYRAVVLAGRRGPDDSLAAAAGAPHRAFLDIHGTPMLERVLRTLVSTPCIAEIVVSIDTPGLLEEFGGIDRLRRAAGRRMRVAAATDSPSRSVLEILDEGPPEQPVLVTTADHPLLDVEMVEGFLARAEDRGGDVAAGLVPSAVVRERFPDAHRTYLPFRDERYSGANLFALMTPRAREAVRFWMRAESFRKRPWRLVATFGLRALLLFLGRRLDLEGAFEEVSRSLGVRVQPIVLERAEAAVDVDKLSDLTLVREILAATATGDQSVRSPSEANPPLTAS
jgi:2-C-methyl-D-erythritol 4-phosphate cytidylyltransferase